MMMSEASPPFLCGVLEGFYGTPWNQQERLDYAGFLSALGLNSYLYCPKNDAFLRKRWREFWPDAVRAGLVELGETYSARGLDWGVGLSPFALYQDYGPQQRQVLKRKLDYLGGLQMPTLAILFDDMPGALTTLADRQVDIVTDVCAWMPNTRILVCPTYYSFDPVLEKHFGTMPEGYWEALGRGLPAGVDVFWTGNAVCSEAITAADVHAINGQLGRKVMLWDNYPVNDGAKRSNFLYTRELDKRDKHLREVLTGHYCNPMNQAYLSLPALLGLAVLYGRAPAQGEDILAEVLGEEVYDQLLLDRDDFQDEGLAGIGERRVRELQRLYAGLPGRAAAEVAGWLRGEYTFDPACLTD